MKLVVLIGDLVREIVLEGGMPLMVRDDLMAFLPEVRREESTATDRRLSWPPTGGTVSATDVNALSHSLVLFHLRQRIFLWLR
jgi:hypothetical protein